MKICKSLLWLLLPCMLCTQALAQASITVSGAYIRGLPPSVENTSAYMTITNDSAQPLTLTGASSPVATRVMLHETVMQNGQMAMQHVMAVEIAGGGELELESGGMHFMLMGLRQPLMDGDQVEFQLQFRDGSTKTLNLPVRSVLAEGNRN